MIGRPAGSPVTLTWKAGWASGAAAGGAACAARLDTNNREPAVETSGMRFKSLRSGRSMETSSQQELERTDGRQRLPPPQRPLDERRAGRTSGVSADSPDSGRGRCASCKIKDL